MDNTTRFLLLEEQIRVHLKAAHRLAACWEYGETQFDEVQDILREAPLGGSMTLAQRAEVKRRACALVPESGVAPWDQMRLIDHASLAKAVSELLAVLIATGHTEETRAFIRQAKLEERAFEETVVAIRTQEMGDIARAIVHYTARIPANGRPAQHGIDVFSLVKKDGSWRIVSIVNEIVRPEVPVPEELRR